MLCAPTKTGAKPCPGFVSSVSINCASHFATSLRQLRAPAPPAAGRAGGRALIPRARGDRDFRVVARPPAVRKRRRRPGGGAAGGGGGGRPPPRRVGPPCPPVPR